MSERGSEVSCVCAWGLATSSRLARQAKIEREDHLEMAARLSSCHGTGDLMPKNTIMTFKRC